MSDESDKIRADLDAAVAAALPVAGGDVAVALRRLQRELARTDELIRATNAREAQRRSQQGADAAPSRAVLEAEWERVDPGGVAALRASAAAMVARQTSSTIRTVKAVRLTPPQIELLTDIAAHPRMYVGSYGRWGRTASALRSRGLATTSMVEGNKTEVVITDVGRAEAVRRGLVDTAPSFTEADRG